MKNKGLYKLVISALFLSMGMVLPLLTGQIKEIGDSLLPMHLPVMLCGAICGWKYGFVVGAILPFLRSLCFGMPPLYPNAVWMAVELSIYGLVIGIMYLGLENRRGRTIISLVTAMLCGRIGWGIAKSILLGVVGKGFTAESFLVGGFVDSLPGIAVQIILIPIILRSYERVLAKGSKV